MTLTFIEGRHCVFGAPKFIEGRHCVFGASNVNQTCPCWQSRHLRGLRGKPRVRGGGQWSSTGGGERGAPVSSTLRRCSLLPGLLPVWFRRKAGCG